MKKIALRMTLTACLFAVAVSAFGQVSNGDNSAMSLYSKGNYPAAIDQFKKEININPSNKDLYVYLCTSLILSGRNQEALDWGLKAVTSGTYDYRIFQSLGEASYNLRNYPKAIEYLERYVSIAPKTWAAQLAYAYYLMGESYMAIDEFNRSDIALSYSVALNPDHEDVARRWDRCGFAREQAGNLYGAVDAYKSAIKADPKLDKARASLSRVEDKIANPNAYKPKPAPTSSTRPASSSTSPTTANPAPTGTGTPITPQPLETPVP